MADKILTFQVIDEQTIHCAGCEQRIRHALQRMQGIQDVNASAHTQQVEVVIDPVQVSSDKCRRSWSTLDTRCNRKKAIANEIGGDETQEAGIHSCFPGYGGGTKP